MKCGVCGKYIALTVAPYQRIYKDEQTGNWKPTSIVCQCDPDDICLWGLIQRQQKRDKKEREKGARI